MPREISSFIDDQGNNRVLIDGKVQPLKYTHQAVISNRPQILMFEQLGEYVDASDKPISNGLIRWLVRR